MVPIGTIPEGSFAIYDDAAEQVVMETTVEEVDTNVVVNEVPATENA